ncbi:phage major capsid protein [Pseudogemmobacter faecipullorum]|uniref:Phage major capsid protein n=1 Tax=Pseudogemmobacter faecipullorum TaxID=2755041 RepID=A0ABS8CR60_9RHOB|nr:phage major capsid protein [Pseudogemmobacter faecipullorum]MCB5411874.1 phage major capsid protein [Pseudogemmobacter faecipullorum]
MSDRIEIKAALSVSDAGEISGTAWPFGSPDRVGDVIEKGAFTGPATLPMLFAHDQAQVIGVWDEFAETDTGLTVKGRLLVDEVERAREVRAMVKAGAVSGLSIGFVTKDAKRHAKGRTISALELHEISIVAVPAHPGAQITSVKSVSSEKDTLLENQETQTPANAPEIDQKALNAVLSRLDKLEAKGQRLGAPAIVQGDADKKAFVSFLQSGQIDQKALTVAADAPAYVLAPEETSGEFIRNLVEFSPIRAIADVRTTASHTILLPKRTGITNAVWVGETTARTASEPTFDQSEITVKELATYVDLSLRMLEDSGNVEAEVRLALAEDFGAKEATAFVNGTAATEPAGFMTAAGIAEVANGHATNLSADALINLFYAMPATYRNRGSWVMNGTTLATVRKLKDGNGNYLWQPSYQAGQPETILGRPVVEALDMPNVVAAAAPIIFGDFKAGYRIYDRVALDVMPDLLTQRITGLARFHARRRVGAGVVRTDVFRKLKMAA